MFLDLLETTNEILKWRPFLCFDTFFVCSRFSRMVSDDQFIQPFLEHK